MPDAFRRRRREDEESHHQQTDRQQRGLAAAVAAHREPGPLGGEKARTSGGTSVITARALVSSRRRHDIHRLVVAPIHANTFATTRLVIAGASRPPQKMIRVTAFN